MNPFTEKHGESVAALGETRLLEKIRLWLGDAAPAEPFGMGDDCAVLPRGKSARLITVDPVIYGGHFNDTMSPRATAQKLLKRNLSDLAAMGGVPIAAVLALTLDRRTSLRWLEGFYRELAACAHHYAVPIVGGDIAEAPQMHLSASLTLLGNPARGGRILTRRGAREGDAIYVTGELGNTLGTGHHYRFTPRLAEGAWLARQRAVHSMIDISDGLAKDLKALETGQQPLSAQIFPGRLPLRRGADLRSAVCGGEDYELIFSLSASARTADFERRWREAFPKTRLTRLGHFTQAGTREAGALNLEDYHGYEHL
ncbi:thiamine-monophosphate kinase [Cephaloticoccus primus]|uniref:Thiamine-monophosphate kinase n=1 Tax=Cephaloticoccus primus TaxID=1548207 RepID=A0A139SML2_9BACT|nr:thiamine-phosphate kinase [Cephaloticoccus primus]KXU35781.1 thiamine-monophosphate kinase [Cephaloticoccus primus]